MLSQPRMLGMSSGLHLWIERMKILQIAEIAYQKGTGCILKLLKYSSEIGGSFKIITIAYFSSFKVDDTVFFNKHIRC